MPTEPTRPTELSKQYEPAAIESAIYSRWLDSGAFRAIPDPAKQPYAIMMPLPNVTGALHMGHAMDNVMQDLLIRWHRMRGDSALWMPGTDHAGIATQAVVEKRLLELEELTRHDVGREGLVSRIWAWKDQYQRRIVAQQQAMGCSCDWDRQRFTMDAVCSRAVRWTFFKLFSDGLIYRGTRLVNWDCFLQTAVSDDEIVHTTVDGYFYHLRYPVIDPQPGEPTHITVATTRPETMLGDTAVACHPDPAGALDALIAETREKLAAAPARDRAAIEQTLAEIETRRETHLPGLLQIAAMAQAGRKVLLPLVDRPIPIILDTWAKPALGSGCVKITPGHDPNDYAVWQRHRGEIDIINILNPDGTLNANAGPFAGIDRFEARGRVEAHLQARGLLEQKEARQIEIGHSDRSKTPIEPYFSLQWFVRMGDVPGGITCGQGTPNAFTAPGLAQSAIDAVAGDWRSPTGRRVAFHPDHERYAGTYLNWLGEKRDWCISRQLWWGHRIPIWSGRLVGEDLDRVLDLLRPLLARDDVHARVNRRDGTNQAIGAEATTAEIRLWERGVGAAGHGDTVDTVEGGKDDASEGSQGSEGVDILVCLRDVDTDAGIAELLEEAGLVRDPDVLDTWFSSGIWPHSTLGWPDPATAAIEPGQLTLGPVDGQPDALTYFYPGSCLVTGRDIITLWVVRMVLMGLYNLGDVPFTDVFIHAIILDGKGERMSKSKGNGIDPVDIIERYGADAMRFVLCEMQTGTQDVRLPVQAISPYTGELIDLAEAKHGRGIFTYLDPKTGQEFDVLGTMPGVPAAKLVSDRFLIGRNFCNKLWNAVRFALMNLEDRVSPDERADAGDQVAGSAGHLAFTPLHPADLAPEDAWILSRLAATVAEVDRQVGAYNPAAAISVARDFFWSDLCDWYLELIKPRLAGRRAGVDATSGADLGGGAAPASSDGSQDAIVARQVLAAVLDQVLRLFHPFVPFITEALWARLCAQAPVRGIDAPLPASDQLVLAAWPSMPEAWVDGDLEARFAFAQEVIRALRELRNQYNVAPSRKVDAVIRANGASAEALAALEHVLKQGAGLTSLTISPEATRAPDAAGAVVRDIEIFVPGVVDLDKERERLAKQHADLAARIEGIQKRLANEAFVTRARPDVVERERGNLAELEAQAESVAGSLAALPG